MGIRKGWALSGARESRCFISHAVSSHPLLEQQTEALHARRQDLPLDAIQTKKKLPLSTSLLVTPSSKGRQDPFFHLSSPSLFPAMKTERLDVLVITLPTFFVFKLSLLTASVDIISAHANDEDRGGGGGIRIHPPSSSSSSSSLIIFFSLGAEGVVCPAETQ